MSLNFRREHVDLMKCRLHAGNEPKKMRTGDADEYAIGRRPVKRVEGLEELGVAGYRAILCGSVLQKRVGTTPQKTPGPFRSRMWEKFSVGLLGD